MVEYNNLNGGKVPDMWFDFSSANFSKTEIRAESTLPL
jgi:hypothetical protein